MKIINGNLLTLFEQDPEVEIIMHGCNCLGAMGAGIAYSIASKYPEVFHAYIEYIQRMNSVGPGRLLGKINTVPVNGKYIVNAFTQEGVMRIGSVNPAASASAIQETLVQALHFKKINSIKTDLYIPEIGCGLGGLEISDLHFAVDNAQDITGEKVTIVKFQ